MQIQNPTNTNDYEYETVYPHYIHMIVVVIPQTLRHLNHTPRRGVRDNIYDNDNVQPILCQLTHLRYTATGWRLIITNEEVGHEAKRSASRDALRA